MRNLLSLLLVLSGAALADPVLPIGRIDTIGGTTYDWQNNGPAVRMLCNAPDYGIHALWMHSADNTTGFPDRNMRYNFYDYSTNTWNWIDPDFMQSGLNVFTPRTGFGNLACDPSSGVAIVSSHHSTSSLAPLLARDMAPGAGIFEYCPGEPVIDGYAWPVIATGENDWIHVAMLSYQASESLWYSRCTTWGNWTPPVHISPPMPDPGFPTHNIAASRVSLKVAVTWVYDDDPRSAFLRVSSDGGSTWEQAQMVLPPQAYGGDTSESFWLGVFPYYDRHDRLHIVSEVLPDTGGRIIVGPVQLWHWCETNTPQWSRIHRVDVGPSSIPYPPGYNAVLAGRPSVGESGYGELFVTWEQFDTTNYEPLTERLRADIWFSGDNGSNGECWSPGIRITDPDASSKRYPCVIDWLNRDSLCILYMVDSVAGFHVYGEGPASRNPVVVQFIGLFPGVESPRSGQSSCRIEVSPNPTSGNVRLEFSPAPPGSVKLSLFDRSGRSVFSARLPGHPFTGSRSLDLSHFPAGVYLLRLETSDGASVQPVVLLKEEP